MYILKFSSNFVLTQSICNNFAQRRSKILCSGILATTTAKLVANAAADFKRFTSLIGVSMVSCGGETAA